MISSRPRISIGMPVYNGEPFLEEALNALLSQTFEDFEVIISDNASTDRTKAICQAYAARDKRIHYCRNDTNLGAAINYNLVFELSSGEYFKWAAHDDICAEDFLSKCVAVLENDSTVVLSYPKTKIIDTNGRLINYYDKRRNINSPNPQRRFHDLVLLHVNCFEIFGVIRSKTLKATRLFGSYAGADRVLLGELSLFGRFYEVPEYLFYRRDHLQTSSRAFNQRSIIVWWDPQKAKRIVLPNWKILIENYIAIRKTPLNLHQRIGCYSVIAKWVRRRWKSLVYDLVLAAKKFIGNLKALLNLNEIRKWIPKGA